MAVSIIQSQVYDGGYIVTHTFPDVDVSGTNTLHIACGFNRNPATEVSSWTSEGTEMTVIKDEINVNVCAVQTRSRLINNALTTTVSTTPSSKLQAGITLGLAGVDQTTPIAGTPVSSQGFGASATQAYTGTAGNLLLVFIGLKDDRTLTASGCTAQTSVTGADANMGTGWCGYVTATGSAQTIGGTWTTDTNWTMVIFEVKVALPITGTVSSIIGTTLSHIVASGTKILIVAAGNHQGTISAVTYGGVSMTKLANAATVYDETAELWGLLNPTAGTANVVMTASGGSGRSLIATNVNNCSTTALPTVTASANGSGTTASVGITTTVANSLVIDSHYSEGDLTTVGALQTQLANIQGATFENAASSSEDAVATGAKTMSWTIASGQRWASVAVAIEPVAAAAAVNSNFFQFF